MSKKILRVIPVLLLLAVVLYFNGALKQEDHSLYYGELSFETYDVYSKVPGIIDSIKVSEGDEVLKDQVLMTVENTNALIALEKAELAMSIANENVIKATSPVRSEDLNIQSLSIEQLASQKDALNQTINGLKSSLNQSLSNAKALKESYDLASENLDRIKALNASGAESRASLDQAEVSYSTAKSNYDSATYQSQKLRADINGLVAQVDGLDAQIASAEERLVILETGYGTSDRLITELNAKLAENDLRLAMEQLSDYSITGKTNGLIESINFSVGEYVNPGTPLITIIDSKLALVTIYVHENDLMNLSIGQRMIFHLASDNSITVEGKIKSIASEAMFTPVNVVVADDRERLVFEVEVSITNDANIRSGMLLVTDFEELE